MKNTRPSPIELAGPSSGRPVRTGGRRRAALQRLLRQRAFAAGMLLLVPLAILAIFARSITPYDPAEILVGVEDITGRTPPCIHLFGCPPDRPQHILGTDGNARDFFSRIVYGARVSLLMGVSTVGAAVLIGTFLGAAAGYHGGWWDTAIMRGMDVLLAFPGILLALVIVSVAGPGLENMSIAIVFVQIPLYARLTRASVLSLKQTEFVEASRSLGGGAFHVLLNRILPNALTPLIVQATLGIASAILDTAALSFLGFGSGLLTPDWGSMIGSELNQLFSAPYLLIFPGLAIAITVFAFNLLGDGLREAFNPRRAYSAPGAETT